jgi:excinuclease ABC subunit A
VLKEGEFIEVRGARQHNLRNLSLDIPRDRLVVVTGLSGSGKSSLAHDTLFAEGQRRYIESLSTYTRQFIDQLERPDVDSIAGLPPTVAVAQDTTSANPRSTVATVTEIYDHLRLLYARVGQVHCHQCGAPVGRQTPAQIVDQAQQLAEGTRVLVLAPFVRDRKGQHRDVIARIAKEGFVRARIDGTVCGLDFPPELDRHRAHTIEAVVDRLVVRDGLRQRFAESVELAVKQSGGTVMLSVETDDGWTDLLFSTRHACARCDVSYGELEPRHFSFNSPAGACPTCDGLGRRLEFDPDLVLPDRDRSLEGGAIAPWQQLRGTRRTRCRALLESFAQRHHFDMNAPLATLSTDTLRALLEGDDHFPGILRMLAAELRPRNRKRPERSEWAADSTAASDATVPADPEEAGTERESVAPLPDWVGELADPAGSTADSAGEEEAPGAALARYLTQTPCDDCGGARLRPESRSVRLAGSASQPALAIHQLTALTVHAAREFFAEMPLSARDEPIARPLLHAIRHRLEFLDRVGLGYLTLDRPATTLSGGESQRVRLAAHIGSGTVGVCYILDEPTIGLHPRDNDRLIDALKDLRDAGNTVLVVEHDEATIRAADHLIDLGPGAGRHGGDVVAAGRVIDVLGCAQSLTAQYLRGDRTVAPRRTAATPTAAIAGPGPALSSKQLTLPEVGPAIELLGARANNLKGIDVRFPLGRLIVVAGVSGSGKSSLVIDTLVPALRRELKCGGPRPGPFRQLAGARDVDKVIEIDQAPLGRSRRSNPATHMGLWDEVRRAFAATRDAKLRGYKASRFSYNVHGGRCEACQGLGMRRVAMQFLPDLYVTCESCRGRRFNAATLAVRYRGRSVADVLAMRVDEAVEVFENWPKIARPLATLRDVGLGYLALGQPATTLSGGEAQRVKLAAELSRPGTGRTCYVLDEPTTGLHFADVENLLRVLQALVERGNTVVVIEHHLDMIRSADWIIDLGPEGGEQGGHIVVCGPPDAVAHCPESYTGRYLRAESLDRRPVLPE